MRIITFLIMLVGLVILGIVNYILPQTHSLTSKVLAIVGSIIAFLGCAAWILSDKLEQWRKKRKAEDISNVIASSDVSEKTNLSEGVVSPEGLEVSLSVGGSKSGRPDFFNEKEITFEELPGPSALFTKCGHTAATSFKMKIYDESQKGELKTDSLKEVDGKKTADAFCPRCHFEKLKQATIRCCLCGHAILPSDAVALYHRSSKGIHKETATYVGDSAVGCLGWDCCPSGGFFAGHWTFEGFRSAFDGQTAAEKCFTSGKTIIGNT